MSVEHTSGHLWVARSDTPGQTSCTCLCQHEHSDLTLAPPCVMAVSAVRPCSALLLGSGLRGHDRVVLDQRWAWSSLLFCFLMLEIC